MAMWEEIEMLLREYMAEGVWERGMKKVKRWWILQWLTTWQSSILFIRNRKIRFGHIAVEEGKVRSIS